MRVLVLCHVALVSTWEPPHFPPRCWVSSKRILAGLEKLGAERGPLGGEDGAAPDLEETPVSAGNANPLA